MNQDSKKIFEESVRGLDVATANRLRLMRRDALTHGYRRPEQLRRWLPAGALAAGLALAAVLWLPQQVAEQAPLAEAVLLEDDSEMLDWLADAPVAIDDSQGVVQ